MHENPVLAVGGRTQIPDTFHCTVQYSKCTAPGSVTKGLNLEILVLLSYFPLLLKGSVYIYHINNICHDNVTGIR